ncbi:hypothetical protein [Roseiflexus sp.]|uniref:hypothetical protein n=1 Tax=Roseiflexus sp. TaxID=2562120 RepID=UPI00398A8F53
MGGNDRTKPDRGTAGATRRLLTDGNGIPLGVAGDGANRNAATLVAATVCQLVIGVNAPGKPAPQRLCRDNGDDDNAVRQSMVA